MRRLLPILLVLLPFTDGCGASAPVVVSGVETGLQFTCAAAHKICEWTDNPTPDVDRMHDQACAAISEVCTVVAPGSQAK